MRHRAVWNAKFILRWLVILGSLVFWIVLIAWLMS